MTDYKQAPKSIVDELAQFIRKVDGNHSMGAGVLAEKICERFRVVTPDVQSEHVESLWMYKGSDGEWKPFINEQHRLNTIADGGWDVREFFSTPAVQGEPLRYTNDGALAECPCCGSIDVGGAHDTVSCHSCDLAVTKPRPLQNAIDAWNTRTGRTHPAPAVQGEPVGEVRFELGAPSVVYAELYSKSLPTLAPGTKLYAAPQPAEQQPAACVGCEGEPGSDNSPCAVCGQQPAPDVAGLVEALERLVGDVERATHVEFGGTPWLKEKMAEIDYARAALAAHRKQGGK